MQDYNYEANYYAVYALNRADIGYPQYQPLLDYLPRAREQAAGYNCSGVHFPGQIAPFGYDAIKGDGPWEDMAIHSNAVLAAINMLQHWEYTMDRAFLREVAFPFARDALAFYQCWMTRMPDGTWVNDRDQSHECQPPNPITDSRIDDYCYQNNSVLPNGLVRRVAQALPGMAKALGVAADPEWAEIADRLVRSPTAMTDDGREVWVLAGGFAAHAINVSTGWCNNPQMCGTRGCKPCPPQAPGAQNIALWQVWPAESIGLASPLRDLKIAQDTMATSAPWDQDNSFCTVFSQAARSGVDPQVWLPKFEAAVTAATMKNNVVSKFGGALEVAGALMAITDLMLMSVTLPNGASASSVPKLSNHLLSLFPLAGESDMRFTALRAKGGFVVTGGWSAATQSLDGAATLHSEVGSPCTLWLPWLGAGQVVSVASASGAPVAINRDNRSRSSFNTVANTTYTIKVAVGPSS